MLSNSIARLVARVIHKPRGRFWRDVCLYCKIDYSFNTTQGSLWFELWSKFQEFGKANQWFPLLGRVVLIEYPLLLLRGWEDRSSHHVFDLYLACDRHEETIVPQKNHYHLVGKPLKMHNVILAMTSLQWLVVVPSQHSLETLGEELPHPNVRVVHGGVDSKLWQNWHGCKLSTKLSAQSKSPHKSQASHPKSVAM